MELDPELAQASAEAPKLPAEQVRRVVLGLVVAIFLAAIDQTIVAVALLAIGRELLDFSLMPWVVAGYLVASTVATPIYGKLSDIHGRRRMLMIAIGIHFCASALAALAQTMPQLVAFRLLQGLGAGGLLALAQATIADIAPGHERGRYQGYLSGTFAAAALLGPVLGGLLTHYISWRAIFVLNLPLGLAAFFVVRRALRYERVTPRAHRIDYPGAVLLAGSLAALMITLTRVGQGVPVGSRMSLALIAAGLLLLVAFVAQERRASEPLLPPALFSRPVFVSCCLILALQFFVLIGSAVLLPLAMQSVGRADTQQVAIRMLPMSLAIPLGAYLAGRHMYRTARYRESVLVGATLAIAGSGVLAWLAAEPIVPTALAMSVLGVGLGLTMPASLVAAQSAVPRAMVGVATSTTALFRTLGGAIGIAVLTSVLFLELRAPGDQAGAIASAPAPIISALLDSPIEPLRDAFRIVFLLTAAASIGALLLSFRLPTTLPKES
ncbi:MAG: MFS transporter [Burkholderiaceae bacterium]|nr:MFS transporter [Burkholderiaceae bacterium]